MKFLFGKNYGFDMTGVSDGQGCSYEATKVKGEHKHLSEIWAFLPSPCGDLRLWPSLHTLFSHIEMCLGFLGEIIVVLGKDVSRFRYHSSACDGGRRRWGSKRVIITGTHTGGGERRLNSFVVGQAEGGAQSIRLMGNQRFGFRRYIREDVSIGCIWIRFAYARTDLIVGVDWTKNSSRNYLHEKRRE